MTHFGKPANDDSIIIWNGSSYNTEVYDQDTNINILHPNAYSKINTVSYNPTACYLFNGNLTDSTSNVNLTLHAGTIVYCPSLTPNSKSIYFNGSTRIKTVNSTSLYTTGALTIQSLMSFPTIAASTKVWLEFGAAGESTITNIVYQCGITTNNKIYVAHESGSAGTDILVNFTSYSLVPKEWYHVVYTRDSTATTHKLYINGIFIDQVAGTNPPTSDAATYTSNFFLGGSIAVSNNTSFYCESLKIHLEELTAEQIKDEFNSIFKIPINSYLPPTIKQTVSSLFTSTSVASPSVATLGAVNIVPNELRNDEIILKTIVSTNTNNTGSVKLYNVTSGAYVHLVNNADVVLSTTSTTPVALTSSNLINATNFMSTSAIYRLEYCGEGTSPITTHYSTEIISR